MTDDAFRQNRKKATDWSTLPDELGKESDRGLVFLAAASLDTRLRELLAAFLIDDKQEVDRLLGSDDHPIAPLSDFSARIDAAHCLGLISQEQQNDLYLIRKIRNHFAQLVYVSHFEDNLIHDWCDRLTTIPEMLGGLETAREQFMAAYMTLELDLHFQIDRAYQDRRVRLFVNPT